MLGGRAADLIGRRPVFLGAVLVFGVASVATAFVDVPTALIALTTPAPSALIARALRMSSRACAVALVAVVRALAGMLKLLRSCRSLP